MVLYLTEQDVGQLITMSLTLEAVEEAFCQLGQGRAENIPRRRLHSPSGMLHLMAASLPGLGYMGYKSYTVFSRRARFLIHLYSTDSGELLAIMEADRLGQMRTGAASGVATRWMARVDGKVVGIIGCGWQAHSQLEAVCQVRPPNLVIASGRSPEKLKEFCLTMQERLQLPCKQASSTDEVLEAADILITITSSASPVFDGSKLRPGTHINAAGSNFLVKRELDETCIRRCNSIVVDFKEQAKLECGEFLLPVERGLLNWEQVHELGEVVTSRFLPRTDAQEITLFKSLGLALEDVAVAGKIYQLAVENKVGKRLSFS
jgi:ornithine cyclodeaminase/alanine dehydrogenase-like protein (mu-crystallin family)